VCLNDFEFFGSTISSNVHHKIHHDSYASSGTGIGVAVRSEFDWQTGYFVVESDDEGVSEEVIIEEKDSYE